MYNLISPDSLIGEGTEIEYGAVISKGVIIGKNCFIGYHTIIRPLVLIGDGSEIRSLCFVAEGAIIGKSVKIIQFTNICKGCIIEDNVMIATGVKTFDTRKISHKRGYKPHGEPPYIEYGARIGSGVLIQPGVRIGRNSMIQAGSVVTKDTDPYGIYRGHPARKIGEVKDEERI